MKTRHHYVLLVSKKKEKKRKKILQENRKTNQAQRASERADQRSDEERCWESGKAGDRVANTLASGQVGRLVNHKLLRNFLVFCVHACVRARRAINGGLGRSTNVCVGRSRKALFTCWLCLKHCTTAVATCGEKERVRSDLTSAETDFDLTLRGYIPKYGAYAYLAIPDWVNACVIFPILFFCRIDIFVSKTNFYFVIFIVFFSHGYTTTSESLTRKMRKQREGLSLRFTLSRTSSNCKVRGRVIRVG